MKKTKNVNQIEEEISGKRTMFALYDKKEIQDDADLAKKKQGQVLIHSNDPEEAEKYNEQGYGIFWTLNEINQGIRNLENLKEIISWGIDVDHKDLKKLKSEFENCLWPSKIVETKNGFQLYWYTDGKATVETFHDIVSDRLVETFHADTAGCNPVRLLRAPGFMHLKNPEEPFQIKCHDNISPRLYSEDQMLEFFKPKTQGDKNNIEVKRELRKVFGDKDELWINVYNMDCVYALRKLSGRECVNGDVFTFMPQQKNGSCQIISNGKQTSCWVDKAGRIGSYQLGGPTIFQWINWYHKDTKKTFKIMMDVFREELECKK